jgi:hypothetical protein
MTAALNILSAFTRCEAASKENWQGKHSTVACIADIGGVLAAMAHVAQFILALTNNCFHKHPAKPMCVNNALELAGAISSAASEAGNIDLSCIHRKPITLGPPKVHGAHCAVDIRSAMQDLLTVITQAITMKVACNTSPENCGAAVTGGIAGLASTAQFVMAAVHDCGANVPIDVACGSSIAGLLGAAARISSVSITVEKACKTPNITESPAKSYTTPAPVLAEFAAWAHGQMASGAQPADIQAQVTQALQANLTKLARKFDLTSLTAISAEDQSSATASVPSASAAMNTLLFGLATLCCVMSFMIGRRTVATKQRPTSLDEEWCSRRTREISVMDENSLE